MNVGIDAISYYVPRLYLEMSDLAERRGIPYEKLKFGLGLEQMAVPDANEDAASFAANALIRLFNDQQLDPAKIGRIYLGTESAVDGSKPTATYAMGSLEDHLSAQFGPRSLKHCDVVDMTFACIGAVDAMQNCLDWVRAGQDRQAIVIASDVSKYELNSTGEYTQGAGAVAVLLRSNPRILSIDDSWGVATQSVGDFFKPRRYFDRNELLEDMAAKLNGAMDAESIENLLGDTNSEFWSEKAQIFELFKEEPVFDGQYSNQCYSDRITEAFAHFNQQQPTDFLKDWDHLVFHLPYAYHGRRIVFDNWLSWISSKPSYQDLLVEIGEQGEDKKAWLKAASKSTLYKTFVKEKIAMGEVASSAIGNMYTASIFMSLLSLFQQASLGDHDLSEKTIGLIAYGSGSKSKVFQGRVMEGWKTATEILSLFQDLSTRTRIDVDTYEKLHLRQLTEAVGPADQVTLDKIETEVETRKGLRTYSQFQ
ncbi:hydroxymethylglutaryl-CoA synthase family protein [Aureitalea marina]|uniref:Hydroxymethylglutaryl-CoA synthase n=1 Tax=Aureitalea marina TaxID=930804 RepID=A0A2S7KSV5_9FLAO|nr:hydroxymethylglutaryl-CoA synthase [Aureitalea marina]PQB05623.1 hypothetical protein BST85_12485 [Aureitalea marina]